MFWIYPEGYFAGLRNLKVICDRYDDYLTFYECVIFLPLNLAFSHAGVHLPENISNACAK
jgi:hypothetical protein